MGIAMASMIQMRFAIYQVTIGVLYGPTKLKRLALSVLQSERRLKNVVLIEAIKAAIWNAIKGRLETTLTHGH